jgi:hypothetical protein
MSMGGMDDVLDQERKPPSYSKVVARLPGSTPSPTVPIIPDPRESNYLGAHSPSPLDGYDVPCFNPDYHYYNSPLYSNFRSQAHSPGTRLSKSPLPSFQSASISPTGLVDSSLQLPSAPDSPNSQYGEHPYGEHPSRTLFVRNINSNVEDDELRSWFEVSQTISSLRGISFEVFPGKDKFP